MSSITGINWANVNLESGYERDQNMLDPYNFDTLLLELNANLPKEKLTMHNIDVHFNDVLNEKIRVAREIFYDNLNNIQQQALKEKQE